MKSIFLSLLALFAEPVEPAPAPNFCIKTCVISENGLNLIKHFEGFSPYPYEDVAGLKTIGFGHLMKPGENIPIPLLGKAAHDLLAKDTGEAQRGVNRHTTVELKPGQFDALVSFTFNLGTGAYRSSTLRKRVNASRHDDVPAQLLRWNKARVNGTLQPVKGLTRRRKAEGKMYDMATKDMDFVDLIY